MRKRPSRFTGQAAEAQGTMESLCSQFGLSLVKSEEDVWGLTMLFQNSTTGVQLEFAPGDQTGWRAVIGKLVAGSFPKHPIHMTQATELQRFDLRDLAVERIHELPEYQDKILSKASLTVSELTEILSRCAADILVGHFTVFSALQSRVLARAQAIRNIR